MTDPFPTTRWSIVLRAAGSEEEGRVALGELCAAYWSPVYVYLRGRCRDRETALDLTQGFFSELIERNLLARVRPESGRFRRFVLHTAKSYLINDYHHSRAQKRGGGAVLVSLDAKDAERRYQRSTMNRRTPEAEFDRQWAHSVVERVIETLRRDAEDRGRLDEFRRVRRFLIDEEDRGSYAQVASELGMSEGSVRVAVHRLRRRFSAALRREVLQTVKDESQVEDEIRFLFAALTD